MSLSLDSKIQELGGVAKGLANKLKKINIETVKDLIFYYPFRYEDYSVLSKISELQPETQAVVIGKIELIGNRRSFKSRKLMTEAMLTDNSGSVKVMWFNQPWLVKNIKIGQTVKLWGKVSGDYFSPILMSPDYQIIYNDSEATMGIMPVYNLTAGLTVRQLRLLIKKALEAGIPVEDILPIDYPEARALMPLAEALKQIHFPATAELLAQARRRLAFEEVFLLQVYSGFIRRNLKTQTAPPIVFKETELKKFIASLPFAMTLDQKRSAWEVIKDLQKNIPMNRLLQGDVGSGKTLVALLAMFNCFLNGCQSVIMAPTEILAVQHYRNFQRLIGEQSDLALITRSNLLWNGESKNKKELAGLLKDGRPVIVVGTHALIQDSIAFGNLGLVIVDEQHRFGVKQRSRLKESNLSGLSPHFLSLTATPIPRSLALAVYGDLDISLIKTMPAGRKAIISRAVEDVNRQKAYDFIRQQINSGRQAFVICPLIDPSDKFGFKSAVEEKQKLDQEIFPEFTVGLLHGRLKPAEKEAVMAEFKQGGIQILVSTSVVEVGVDIPNATVMMIEGSERFGLAQLHQFRGRVGRGEHQAYCFFFAENADGKIISKLKFLADCADGFRLAEYDLQHRGAGAIWGENQSGWIDNLRIADLNDTALIKSAQAAAEYFWSRADNLEIIKFKNKINHLGFIEHLE